MSEHRHVWFVEGCARCDLSRDEAAPTTAAEVLARALFFADADPGDPAVGDRLWASMCARTGDKTLYHEQADRLAGWLAQHDREVAAGALRDAADAESVPVVVAATGIHGRAVMDVSLVLRAHRIESGEGA
jgi:hypothetical protein